MMHLDHTASGVYAIAPTPFTPDGAVDEKSIDEWSIFTMAAASPA